MKHWRASAPAPVLSAQDRIASTPQSVVLRSLRRRFRQALAKNDAALALRAFQATRADWEQWCLQEEEEEAAAAAEGLKYQQGRPSQRTRENQCSSFKSQQQSSATTLAATTTASPPAAAPSSSSALTQQSSHQAPQQQKSEKTAALLFEFMLPTDPFLLDDYYSPHDSYDTPIDDQVPPPPPQQQQPPLRIRHRVLPWWFRKQQPSQRDHHHHATTTTTTLSIWEHPDRTTPLHEAARVGSPQLTRQLLLAATTTTAASAGGIVDVNVRNGALQTPLHLVAGGGVGYYGASTSTGSDDDDDEDDGIEIAPPPSLLVPPLRPKNNRHIVFGWRHKKKRDNKNNDKDKKAVVPHNQTNNNHNPKQQQQQTEETDRIATAQALLSQQGASTNSVDAAGRTALHYAAAMGRTALCLQVLVDNHIESLLTVVDHTHGRTPCEWAARNHHHALAAALEARAVLYTDPYGMEEELLVGVREPDGFSRKSLVAPFAWFVTLHNSMPREREARLEQGLRGIKVILVAKQEQAAAELGASRAVVAAEESSDDEEQEDDSIPSSLPDEFPLDEDEHVREDQSESSRLEEHRSLEEASSSEHVDLAKEQDILSQLMDTLNKTHVEIFLANHGWDVEAALCSFYRNPLETSLKDAGLSLPPKREVTEQTNQESLQMCLICCEVFDTESSSTQWRRLSSCDHSFCADCMGEYLAEAAKSRTTGLSIRCPHHACNVPLSPMEIVELAPTTDAFEALLRTANENMVLSAKDLRYCPHPGCEGVVKFSVPSYARKYINKKGLDTDLLETVGAVCTAVGDMSDDVPLTYEGVGDPHYYQSSSSVQPSTAHRFCFQCGELFTHWPVPCATLNEWNEAVKVKVGEVEGDSEKHADVAQKLWMKTNTRSCPKVRLHVPNGLLIRSFACNDPVSSFRSNMHVRISARSRFRRMTAAIT